MARSLRRWPQPHWADLITLTGLLLTVNEAVLRSGPERPGIQFMCIAMMGVSPAVRIDERRNARKRRELEPERDEDDERPSGPPGRFGR